MGSVVVVVDVVGDLGACMLDGLPFAAPGAALLRALLELPEPGLDELLSFGVAVAAAPAFAVHRLTELSCGERRDHPGAVRRVRFRDLDEPGITGPAPVRTLPQQAVS